ENIKTTEDFMGAVSNILTGKNISSTKKDNVMSAKINKSVKVEEVKPATKSTIKPLVTGKAVKEVKEIAAKAKKFVEEVKPAKAKKEKIVIPELTDKEKKDKKAAMDKEIREAARLEKEKKEADRLKRLADKKAAIKAAKPSKKCRVDIFMKSFNKANKFTATKKQLIEIQLAEYGGTLTWANYQVDNLSKMLVILGILEVTAKNTFKMKKFEIV